MTVKQTQPSVQQQAKMWVMIGRQMSSSYPGWTIIISAVVGLIIGLFFAWMIWPLNWTEVKPSSLSNIPQENKTYKQVFLNFAATAYATGSMPIDQVAYYLGEGWTKADIIALLDQMIKDNYAGNAAYLTAFRDALNGYTGSIGPQPPAQQGPSPLVTLLLILLIIFLLVLLIFIVWRILRRRSEEAVAVQVSPAGGEGTAAAEAAPVVVPAVSRAAGGARTVEKTAWPGESRPPMTQFVTTYAVGDDRYDMSNSIETSSGDFLGECGVGISETIGTGSPEKVTALELWLFDKNDVRTLTKVLMSEHAYNDGAVRAKLAPKGDAVMIHKGDTVDLTTQTLKLNARVVDLIYGSGGGLPPNSFFQQVTLEIATWDLSS
jgi:membrane protein implicated in regulation of membrane protease activity